MFRAHSFFVSDMKPIVTAEKPGIAQSEVSKEVGERWKALSAEGRAPFVARAEADKQRYKVHMSCRLPHV